jgi:hypothetical protein
MKKIFFLLAFFLAGAPAFGHKAHTHGVAKLNLAVEGDTVEIGFETPLINLISFERAPKNDKEREEARKMESILKNPHTLFLFPEDAQCSLKTSRLESVAIAHEPDNEKHSHETEHADLDAEFVFTCQNPLALNRIEVRLFQAFPAMKRIEATLITPRGQKAMRLTPRANRLQW